MRAKGETNRTIRYAVVGQGHFAQSAVLPAFDAADNCELVALFSDDATKLDKLKRTYDVEYALGYEQYDEFLRSGAVDAVYIALPNDLHCDYTVRAAAAGIHVLCEKPMAVSSEEAEKMIDACQQAKVKLMIAYRLHFEEGNLSAIDLVADGKLGQPRYFTSSFSQQVTPGNIRTKSDRAGGPLYDLGVYCINAARYLFRAEPTEVVALSTARPDDPRFAEVEEQISALLRFPNECLASFTCGFGASRASFYELVGTEGLLRMDPAYSYAEALRYEVVFNNGKTKKQKFRKRDQIAAELIYFADCIGHNEEPEPSGKEGLADIRIIEAIKQSAATGGQPVAVQQTAQVRRPDPSQEIDKSAHGQPDTVNVEPPSR